MRRVVIVNFNLSLLLAICHLPWLLYIFWYYAPLCVLLCGPKMRNKDLVFLFVSWVVTSPRKCQNPQLHWLFHFSYDTQTCQIQSRSGELRLSKMKNSCACLFVCFVALRPKSTAMVMAGRTVHLTTLLPGQAWTLTSTSCTYFRL